MPIIQKIKRENQLKSSQSLYRSIIFSLIFIILWFLLVKVFSFKNDHYFLSQIEITTIWVFSIFIIILFWFIFLIFLMGDNTLKKLWEVLKLRGTFSTPSEIRLRWYALFLMIIFSVYFSSPGLYSHINALSHRIIYSGDVRLNEIHTSKKHDNRFIKVDVKMINREFVFEGSADEVNKLVNRNLNMTIYEGLFFEYALIEK